MDAFRFGGPLEKSGMDNQWVRALLTLLGLAILVAPFVQLVQLYEVKSAWLALGGLLAGAVVGLLAMALFDTMGVVMGLLLLQGGFIVTGLRLTSEQVDDVLYLAAAMTGVQLVAWVLLVLTVGLCVQRCASGKGK